MKADLLHQHLWDVPIVYFVRFGIIFLLALILKRYLSGIITRLFYSLFRRFASTVHTDKFGELLRKPVEGVLLTFLFYLALNQLDLLFEKIVLFKRHKASFTSFTLMELIDHLFFFFGIFNIVLLITRVITFLFYVWVQKAIAAADRERQQLLPLLRDVFVVLLWAFGFFTILGTVFHVNVATLIAGLGMGGVAVAFAAKESLENLLASFMIMIDKPLTIGDWIKVGNVEGTVEQIGFRSTRIRTFDRTQVSLPNKNLIGDTLENFSERGMRRVKFMIGAVYGTSRTNLEKIISDVKKMIMDTPHTTGTPSVYLDSFADSSINIQVTYFVVFPTPVPFEDIKQQINFGIYRIMYQYGKGFAYPTQLSIPGEDINEVEPS
jgi:MscS family membrane protein